MGDKTTFEKREVQKKRGIKGREKKVFNKGDLGLKGE